MEGFFGLFGQLFVIFGRKLTEGIHFGVTPGVFDGVEFRGIGWKIMKRQSFAGFGEAFYFFGAMCRQTIPDNDDVSPDVEFELAEEINASGAIEIFVGMKPEVEGGVFSWFKTKGADNGYFLETSGGLEKNGGFSFESPGSSDQGSHQDSRFINEGKGGLGLKGFFLTRGHVWRTQF